MNESTLWALRLEICNHTLLVFQVHAFNICNHRLAHYNLSLWTPRRCKHPLLWTLAPTPICTFYIEKRSPRCEHPLMRMLHPLSESVYITEVSLLTLMYAADGFFGQYQMTLKSWNIIDKPRKWVFIWENWQRMLSNEYQQDQIKVIFKNLCILVLRTKVASALERLTLPMLRLFSCNAQKIKTIWKSP